MALFLASIGNPAPSTVIEPPANGICRPSLAAALNILRSTATIMNVHDSPLYAPTVQQGAGLVHAYRALTTKTVFWPSELSINDTIRRKEAYKVKLYNMGNDVARYKITHQGAALATGIEKNNDQLLALPLLSPSFAVS